MNFARFIPGTPDADYMRQQVGERGILEKIDAVNETIKRCVGKDHPVSEIADFYKMITDIEHSLNQNMNDPRAKKLVNTFDETPETPKVETKKETPEKPDTTDPNEDAGVNTGTDTGTVDPIENTGVTDPAEGGETGETVNTGITDNPVSEGTSEGAQETTGDGDNSESEGISEGTQETAGDSESTGPDTTEPESKQPTRKGRKKSEGAE